ncbi:FAD binding domain-containing protein [Pseudarcicella hirudinis]|nr:FAD binding domain-containing protein [Pseudarcicella hirudinis]
MIQFILNNKEISTSLPPGMLLLDFIRYHQHLTGTKIGCREGDCGACTVLLGELKTELNQESALNYRSVTSCLTPLGNVQGKHVVSIEGINMQELNPIQKAMSDESATQCGFCTPGFIMSLSGFCLSRKEPSPENAIASVDGNICRCTGYKSIERAVACVSDLLKTRDNTEPALFAAEQKILPAYFSGIRERLLKMEAYEFSGKEGSNARFVGGGTDLYVQKHDEMTHASIRFMLEDQSLKGIEIADNKCILGASSTVTDFGENPALQSYFPELKAYIKLISSTPIRNIATIAGNFVNASPIGDLTIFFLALETELELSDGKNVRTIPLRKFHTGYKQLDKRPEEFITRLWFELPFPNSKFNFEKVSKRTHLDIASVNSALSLQLENDAQGNEIISKALLSAGGVGPTPVFLEKTAAFLKGKTPDESLIIDIIKIAQTEIKPISDARGTEVYKRLLLSQLIKAHFLKFFPQLKAEALL